MLDFEAAGIYERENRDWRPHVTVARFRTPPRLRPALPELGSFSPLDVALYESTLSPAGSALFSPRRRWLVVVSGGSH